MLEQVLELFERMRAATKGGKGAGACKLCINRADRVARMDKRQYTPPPDPTTLPPTRHTISPATAGEEEEGGKLSDYIAYNSVLEALKMEGDWRQALKVLQEMKGAGLKPNLVNHNTVCALWVVMCGGLWMARYGLHAYFPTTNPPIQTPTNKNRQQVMDALAQAGEREEALSLLKAMKSPGSGCKPDKRTYTAAIKAMIKKVRWRAVKRVWGWGWLVPMVWMSCVCVLGCMPCSLTNTLHTPLPTPFAPLVSCH